MRSRVLFFLSIGSAWITSFAGVTSPLTVVPASQSCAPTPAQAVRAEVLSPRADGEPRGVEYRVAAVHWDPLLRQKWVTVSTCGHPEFPTIAIPISDSHDHTPFERTPSNSAAERANVGLVPQVRAGDHVHLWRRDQAFHIELIGVAEDNAPRGGRVRVRVLRSGSADTEKPQIFSGVVRGVDDVEIER